MGGGGHYSSNKFEYTDSILQTSLGVADPTPPSPPPLPLINRTPRKSVKCAKLGIQ